MAIPPINTQIPPEFQVDMGEPSPLLDQAIRLRNLLAAFERDMRELPNKVESLELRPEERAILEEDLQHCISVNRVTIQEANDALHQAYDSLRTPKN